MELAVLLELSEVLKKAWGEALSSADNFVPHSVDPRKKAIACYTEYIWKKKIRYLAETRNSE